jgi:hypothetical protein
MELKKIIKNTIRQYLNENSMDDIMRDVFSKKFEKESEISDELIINQNKAKYDIIKFLISLGFYQNTEYNIHYNKETNFKPNPSDYVGTFSIVDFIKEHKKYLSKKYNVSPYSITDRMWDESLNDVIKPKIIDILSKYDFELVENPFSYGQGDLLVKIKTPNTIEYGKKYPQVVMKNPEMVMSSKQFFGIEDRKEKKKYIKHTIDNIEYKFLTNPINQDKFISTGDKGVFGGLFGGILTDFLGLKNLEFKKVIIQIHKDWQNYNFVIAGDGFYYLDDIKKFEEDENFNIKKISTSNRFYSKLIDLKNLYDKIPESKMIVFLDIGGDLTKTKNGGLLDKNKKIIYYPYLLKK